jgi:hypothetical protein
MEDRKRYVPGAELFVSETIMEGLADLGDGAYDTETPATGLVLGKRFSDSLGTWAEITSISGDEQADDLIGWFRTSEGGGVAMSPADVKKHISLFGKQRAYAIMIDPQQSSLAFYTVEDGEPVSVRAVVVESR